MGCVAASSTRKETHQTRRRKHEVMSEKEHRGSFRHIAGYTTQLYADYFINHANMIPIKQAGFIGK